ncbi:ERF family protein, partial [Escherichia coli]|uniref:ERF family protein n=1 Tax=Escherichia coli TaxID=562 RepID=UPI003CE4F95B
EDEQKKGMDLSQLTGSTSSYARKYALNGLFAIDDTKDSDYTNKHGKEQSDKSNQGQLTDAQIKRLYAIAYSVNIDADTVR